MAPACGCAVRSRRRCCAGLSIVSEDVTKTFDYVPGRFRVTRHIREKLSCGACDMVVAALAPDPGLPSGRLVLPQCRHPTIDEVTSPVAHRADMHPQRRGDLPGAPPVQRQQDR